MLTEKGRESLLPTVNETYEAFTESIPRPELHVLVRLYDFPRGDCSFPLSRGDGGDAVKELRTDEPLDDPFR